MLPAPPVFAVFEVAPPDWVAVPPDVEVVEVPPPEVWLFTSDSWWGT